MNGLTIALALGGATLGVGVLVFGALAYIGWREMRGRETER